MKIFKATAAALLMRIAWPFACVIVSLWLKTLRVRCENEAAFASVQSTGYVLTFWHAVLLVGYHHHRTERAVTLLSLSRDGSHLAKLTTFWGYQIVRGSRHRKGAEALNGLREAAQKTPKLILTPDGSRGPACKMKPGAVIVARDSQLPLIAAGLAIERCKTLKTWDRFCIPMPFSRVAIVYSDPMYLKADMGRDETDDAIKTAETELNRVHSLAAETFCSQ